MIKKNFKIVKKIFKKVLTNNKKGTIIKITKGKKIKK